MGLLVREHANRKTREITGRFGCLLSGHGCQHQRVGARQRTSDPI
jgi:hypothetical protein